MFWLPKNLGCGIAAKPEALEALGTRSSLCTGQFVAGFPRQAVETPISADQPRPVHWRFNNTFDGFSASVSSPSFLPAAGHRHSSPWFTAARVPLPEESTVKSLIQANGPSGW